MFRRSFHPALVLALLAAALGLLFFGLHRFRHRIVGSNVDLVRLLPSPEGDFSTFFLNVELLRRGGYLDLLSPNTVPVEADYRQFVQETNFDFARDVDAIAGALSTTSQLDLFIKGRLDWSRLRAYATRHSGSCDGSECRMPARNPGRWISFAELQPDTMALAVTPDRNAASALVITKPGPPEIISSDPAWLRPSKTFLQQPNALPQPLRMFAIAIQSAQTLLISFSPDPQAAFDIKLQAHFALPAIANTSRNQLEIDTKMMKLELARERAQPNPADLTGLLTSSRFTQNGKVLEGIWPVSKELLQAMH